MPEPDDATPTVIAGASVLMADGRVQPGSVVIEGGTIAEVTTRSVRRRGANVIEAQGRLVVPGLVDLHLHGAGGASLESVVEPAADPERGSAVPRVLRHLARAGVTATFASLASDAVETMARRSRALARWREHPLADGAELLGAHLEGPFLSPAQAGAHDPALLVAPGADDVARLVETRPAMITLAPELPGALAATRSFADAGTVVAIGHSEAGPEEVAAAVEAGASHLTHLWSGQSSTTRTGPWRVPGLLEASLSSAGLTAEVIADGKHLPRELLEIARRCLGGNLVVVSDATEGAGMPDGFRYGLASVQCEVRDGVGMVVGQPAFGGSTTTLDGMLAHLCLELGWPVPEVVEMLSARPASIAGVGERKGRLAAGFDADLLVLDDQLRPWRTWVRGTPALLP
ncbi:N-acetylglucosamine-6-phosphate deacetylase [Pseudactinotalea suaedae]|uniref:N-acetylglucosamine-6-phosphate deacetylase n=1 Tax=Pseudactinotalea suaedae TaxID=1524924 RepID=UPI0012E1E010|nr:amidohydrolase family protein [Pseudactinotalea suaedae]